MAVRRFAALACVGSLMVGAVVVLPVVTAPAASPAPVKTTTTVIPLSGVDVAAVSGTPRPKQSKSGPALKLAVATPMTTTSDFGLVAVSAPRPLDPASSVAVRLHENGAWGAWTTLEIDADHAPDPGSQEAAHAQFGTEPLMTTRADGVQVRIDTPTGTVPAGTGLSLVESPQVAADSNLVPQAPMATADATAALPPIIMRAAWGADESKRARGPVYSDTIKVGFVHHTASSSNYSPDQAAAQMRMLYGYYTDVLKYSDLAYNFLVDRFGRLYEGRAGGIELPVIGGHTAGFNTDTFAISAIGNFDETQPNATDGAAMRESISSLLAWKLGLYHRDPLGTTTLTSNFGGGTSLYEPGEVAKTNVIEGHGEIGSTACPGKYIRAWLPQIRTMAAEKVGPSIFNPRVTGSTWGNPQALNVSFTTNAPLAWTMTVTSLCGTVVRKLSGTVASAGTATITWNGLKAKGVRAPPGTYKLVIGGVSGKTPVLAWNGAGTITATSDSPADPCGGPESFSITGTGYGHGVGLSQWGALGMARAGKSAAEIVTHYFTGTSVAPVPDAKFIKVGLLYQVPTASFQAEPIGTGVGAISVDVDGRTINGTKDDSFSLALNADDKIVVTRTRGAKSWPAAVTSAVAVRWTGTRRPADGTPAIAAQPAVLDVAGPGEKLGDPNGDHRYRYGRLLVSVVQTTKGPALAVVDSMRVHDEYLYGIAEVDASWPLQALRAQVLAARSYALAKIDAGLRTSCACHVDDGGGPFYDQTYWGYARETRAAGANWMKAVESSDTAPKMGEAILYAGKPIFAYYTASTGGATQSADDVWGGGEPYAVSVDDHWSLSVSGNPYRSWTVQRTQAQVAAAFGLPDVASMSVTASFPSTAASEVTAVSSGGVKKSLSGSEFRAAFGLLSTYVTRISWTGGTTPPPVTPTNYTITAAFTPALQAPDGSTVTVAGKVAPATSGLVVVRQKFDISTNAWVTRQTTQTDTSGAFNFSISPMTPKGTTYRYRFIVLDGSTIIATSAEFTYKVL